jgi:hypothetical protein
VVADAYGLDHGRRIGLLGAIGDAMSRVEAAVRAGVATGHVSTVELWHHSGGATRFARRRRWWDEHCELFAAALIASPPESLDDERAAEASRRPLTPR